MHTIVRQYNATVDTSALRACIAELQNFEREFDPRMPVGESIADACLSEMLERCDQHAGQIFVAEADGDILGYVTVLTRMRSGDVDDGNIEFGLVSDVMVQRKHRKRGIGRRLIETAATYAKSRDVRWLRITVLAENASARRLYESLGFSSLYVDLEKDLQDNA